MAPWDTGDCVPTKREDIITAALGLYRAQGICRTTLKDVAAAAGVPLGNLYYHVRTRGELTQAVLDVCEAELDGLLAHLRPRAPRDWLLGYLDWLLADPDAAAREGCPFGALAVELRALGEPAAERAAELVRRYGDAVSTQARQVPGSGGEELFFTVQGAYTVAHVLGDGAVFQARVAALRGRLGGSG